MKLQHARSVLPAASPPARICALAWAPTLGRLAVATADRVVHLADDAGERRDKFATKPADAKVTLAPLRCHLAPR